MTVSLINAYALGASVDILPVWNPYYSNIERAYIWMVMSGWRLMGILQAEVLLGQINSKRIVLETAIGDRPCASRAVAGPATVSFI